uniref:Homeobox domain-containing protein n=1 Tax=Heterorhabditis bacteriophora TaxID=37862 RepID=A0A1I7WBD2_HETBA
MSPNTNRGKVKFLNNLNDTNCNYTHERRKLFLPEAQMINIQN